MHMLIQRKWVYSETHVPVLSSLTSSMHWRRAAAATPTQAAWPTALCHRYAQRESEREARRECVWVGVYAWKEEEREVPAQTMCGRKYVRSFLSLSVSLCVSFLVVLCLATGACEFDRSTHSALGVCLT
jgi:hypothetical protein